MSDENPVDSTMTISVDNVAMASCDVYVCEKSPESINNSSRTDKANNSFNSENSGVIFVSDSHNRSPVSDTINISSGSDIISLSPSDTIKMNPVSDVFEAKCTTDTSEKNPVIDLSTGNQVDMSETNLVETSETNLVEMSETNLVEMSETNLVVKSETNLIDMSETNLIDMSETNLIDMPETNRDDLSETNLDDLSETNLDDLSETNLDMLKTNLVAMSEANLVELSDVSAISNDMYEDNSIAVAPEIPGFNLSMDEEESLTSVKDTGKIELVGFDLKPYILPDSERFGDCRLISEFDKLTYVGEGSFGIVYRVLDKKYDTVVALKKMKISLKDEESLSIPVIREINLLRDMEHPNIVNSRGIAVGRNFDSTYLILDYCEFDLSKVIDDEKSSAMLEEPQVKCIMIQLFDGLKYIHKNCVLHRDLSCSNILFTSEGILKIGDFGLSRLMAYEEAMTPNVVSRWYRAPELLLGSTYYSFAIDVWSAGCVFAEVILKKPLFKANSDMKMIASIIDLLGTPTEKIWPGCSKLPVMETYELTMQPNNNLKTLFAEQSKSCLDLLSKLFTYDPQNRISAASAFSHAYFPENPHPCSPGDLVQVLKVTDEIQPK